MPNNANYRIYFAITSAAIAPDGTSAFTASHAVHGLQSVGMTTSFSLDQIFELGQLSIYDNVETLPSVECTMEKVLDGYPLIYHLATAGSNGDTLANRSTKKCMIGFGIYPDTYDAASGSPYREVICSGMFPNNLSYTFPVEGSCTESVGFVGNNKLWNGSAPFKMGSFFNNADSPRANVYVTGSGGVQLRDDVRFDVFTGATSLDANGMVNNANNIGTILPPDIPGITASGTNELQSDGSYGAHIQTITVSTDLGRTDILELGRRKPFYKYLNFPIEVTCSIDVHSGYGDGVSATEDGTQGNGNNLTNRTIKISTKDGTFLNLGTKNKLSSVTQTGGDTGGGNQSLTYNYSNFNDLVVSHPQAP